MLGLYLKPDLFHFWFGSKKNLSTYVTFLEIIFTQDFRFRLTFDLTWLEQVQRVLSTLSEKETPIIKLALNCRFLFFWKLDLSHNLKKIVLTIIKKGEESYKL